MGPGELGPMRTPPLLEVPGPQEPEMPPDGPAAPPVETPPDGPAVPEPVPPTEPQPGAPDVPTPDPGGPETDF